jgi:hypothetical protein
VNGISTARTEHNNAARGSINNHHKTLCNVAPKYAHVEHFPVATSYKFAAKDDRPIAVARHANLSFDRNSLCQSADAANLTAGLRLTEGQHHEQVFAENCPIGARVYEELRSMPLTVIAKYPTSDHGTPDPVLTQKPLAIKSHTLRVLFSTECNA